MYSFGNTCLFVYGNGEKCRRKLHLNIIGKYWTACACAVNYCACYSFREIRQSNVKLQTSSRQKQWTVTNDNLISIKRSLRNWTTEILWNYLLKLTDFYHSSDKQRRPTTDGFSKTAPFNFPLFHTNKCDNRKKKQQRTPRLWRKKFVVWFISIWRECWTVQGNVFRLKQNDFNGRTVDENCEWISFNWTMPNNFGIPWFTRRHVSSLGQNVKQIKLSVRITTISVHLWL